MNPNSRGVSRTGMIVLLLLAVFIGWWACPNRGYAATVEVENPNWWMVRTCQTDYQVNCYADERFATYPYVIRTIPGPVTCTFYVDKAYAAVNDHCVNGRGRSYIAGPDRGQLLPWWTGRHCKVEDGPNCYFGAGRNGKGHPFRSRVLNNGNGGKATCILYVEYKYSLNHDHCTNLGYMSTGVMPRGEVR